MVDQQNTEEVQQKEVAVAKEEMAKHERTNTKICRSESMESEVVLFVPESLGSKKKAKTTKHLRKCPNAEDDRVNQVQQGAYMKKCTSKCSNLNR